MFYFSDFSQRLYIVAVLLRRIQLPLTALGLISFPRVQMSPAMLTGNQQNVSGAWHMTTRSDFPYKDNNLPQENGSLESSRTLRCSISWECSFTDRITMYLIVYKSWDLYFWYEWPLLSLWTPTCSVFSNYYLKIFSTGMFPFSIDVSQFRGGQPQHQVRVLSQSPGESQAQVVGGAQFLVPGEFNVLELDLGALLHVPNENWSCLSIKPYTCISCGKKKKNSGNLAAHDREINSHVVLPIVCSAMEG